MCASYGLDPLSTYGLEPLDEREHRFLLEQWIEQRGGNAKITGKKAVNLNPLITSDEDGHRELDLAWAYWEEDMFESWPAIAKGLGFDEGEARAQTEKAKVDYLEDNPGMGAEGSTPVSSLLPVFDAVEQELAE